MLPIRTIMIATREEANDYELNHPIEFQEAFARWKELKDSKERAIVALRVGSDFEEKLIMGWLAKNNMTFGNLIRILFFNLGTISDADLAVMRQKKFDCKFLDYLYIALNKVDEVNVQGTLINPHTQSSIFFKAIKEPSYRNLTAQIDPFLKNPWTEYFKTKGESGALILKREMTKLGVYPVAYFDSVIAKSAKKKTVATRVHTDDKQDVSEKKVFSKGINCSGELAQKLNAFKAFLAENKLSLSDVIRYELAMKHNFEFTFGNRSLKHFKEGVVANLQQQLPLEFTKSDLSKHFLFAFNFAKENSDKVDAMVKSMDIQEGKKRNYTTFFVRLLVDGGWAI